MILRLKKDIKGLKDELELVTGEARTEQLTKEELDKYVICVFDMLIYFH